MIGSSYSEPDPWPTAGVPSSTTKLSCPADGAVSGAILTAAEG